MLAEFAASDQFFMSALLFLVHGGYHRHPRLMEALGVEARAPHPAGHTMDADAWSLPEPVRRRGQRA